MAHVAFIGHEQHLRSTKSSRFFIELLEREWGPVRVFTRDRNWLYLPKGPPWDVVVFFQHMPERLLLDSVTMRHVVLVPMYDDCPTDKEFWAQYTDCGIVCFCRALADRLEGWGHRVHRAQYFPQVPAEPVDWSHGLRSAFFWPRKPDLGWPVARSLLSNWDWDGVHLHVTEAEPVRTREITPEDRARFHITQSRWFPSRAEFQRELARSQAFLAPRRIEGIGMSFLEAMALGMAVAAPDGPTMNEYIRSGVNGFLYDPDDPAPPSWSDARRIGGAARASIIEGRERWLRSIPALTEFLRDPGLVREPGRMVPASHARVAAAVKQFRRSQLRAPLRVGRSAIAAVLRKTRLMPLVRRLLERSELPSTKSA